MPTWLWVVLGVAAGWAAGAVAGAAVIGRLIRRADHLERHHLPDPAAPPPGYVVDDGLEPSLAGAILALGYSTDEPSARYWLDVCAQRGANWALQQQLWQAWERDHARNITRLHTDNEDDL